MDSRIVVHVYGPDTQQAETYTATLWPAQNFTRDGYETREEAISDFPEKYNVAHATSKTPEDFRFIGPIYAGANIRELPDGTWEATCYADKPYRLTADSEEEVKAAFVPYYEAEYRKVVPDAFPYTLTDANYDWTYNPDG